MATPLIPAYPVPDRSDQAPSLMKNDDGIVDIGWCDGVMNAGRPFRAEMWAQDGISMLTVFFSAKGIESMRSDQLQELVVKEGLVAFRTEAQTFCQSAEYTDCAGNLMWSVNVVVGNDEGSFLTASTPIFPYSRTSDTNTMFNTRAIKGTSRSRA